MSSLNDFAGWSEVLIERSIKRGSMRVMRSAREERMLRCVDGTTLRALMAFETRIATFSAIRDRFGLHSFLLVMYSLSVSSSHLIIVLYIPIHIVVENVVRSR